MWLAQGIHVGRGPIHWTPTELVRKNVMRTPLLQTSFSTAQRYGILSLSYPFSTELCKQLQVMYHISHSMALLS